MKKLALILLLVLAAGAAAYYFFYWSPSRARGPLPELVTLAPDESEWVIYLDAEAWRASSLPSQLQKLLPNVTQDSEYQSFVQATGFEYSRDLHRVVLALLPVDDPALRRQSAYQVIAFAEGRLDRDKITRYAMKNGSKEAHEQADIIVVSKPNSGNSAPGQSDATLFAFLSDERVGLADVPGGDVGLLDRARKTLLGAAQSEKKEARLPELAERATRVAGAPFFAVGRAKSLQLLRSQLGSLSPTAAQLASVLADVRWLTIAARPEQDQIRLALRGECESVIKATQLGLLLDGLLLLSRGALDDPKTRGSLSREQAEQLDRVLATAKVVREQNAVEIRMEIPIRLLANTSVRE